MPEDFIKLCDRAPDRQKDAETAERLYRQLLREISLDPHATNNRDIATVDNSGEVIDENDLPLQE